MNALIICPVERPHFRAFTDEPLVNLPLFGSTVLMHWLEHLAGLGARQVRILAGVEPEQIETLTGEGSRWGLALEILARSREPSVKEARLIYCSGPDAGQWLKPPNDVVLADHLPGQPQNLLFNSYADYFAALVAWLPVAANNGRAGLRQIQPGVWAGLRTRISAQARLIAPAWIGDDAQIGKLATIGPNAILEDRVLVGANTEISNSFVGPDTAVGASTRLIKSLAMGDILVDWRRNSVLRVADPFLLSALRAPSLSWRLGQMLGRFAAKTAVKPQPLPRPAPTPAVLEEKPAPLPRSAAQ